MTAAQEALQRLKEGNRLYLQDGAMLPDTGAGARIPLVAAQNPFAIILGCSDSRVPAEIVYGQGLGDLFVIRIAGNIVAPSQIASVEFAAENFGTRLVVVLGHSMCGAVVATLEQLIKPTESRSPHLYSIVDRIRPSIEPLLQQSASAKDETLIAQAVRANIEASVNNLSNGSPILQSLIADDGLMVVGAEYCLSSGVVEFFDT